MDKVHASGHLFIVHGDLKQVHADDVLIPCDTQLNVTAGWSPLLGSVEPGHGNWVRPAGVAAVDGFDASERLPIKLTPVGGRRIWLVNSGGRSGDLKWLVSGVRQAIRQVSAAATEPARHGRSRQLIAMPVFGVGDGGFGRQRGAVIKGLLDTILAELAAPGSPDVVVVVTRRADYAAAQSIRRVVFDDTRVGTLANRVRAGGLVLFIGSGASAGAGLPTWKGLLEELAERAGLDGDVRQAVLDLPAPDAADVTNAGLGADDLGSIIAEKFRQDGFSLIHGLLAGLRVPEAVTTNYDRLYENASTLPHQGRLIVLPHSRRTGDEPWLLKLHGDLEPSTSIVLTRDHYVRFDADSIPLASVVQSHMVTKHMLFVGYSLSDENFIRLARQVRQLFARTGTGGSDKVGTVLSLFADPGRQRLWQDDLHFLPVLDTPFDKNKIPSAARELEIFLDDLALASCDEASYVLDSRYADLLTEIDHELATALEPLIALAESKPISAAWAKVTSMLGQLGREVVKPSDLS